MDPVSVQTIIRICRSLAREQGFFIFDFQREKTHRISVFGYSFFLYDYILCIPAELSFVWPVKGGLIKHLFLSQRYAVLILGAIWTIGAAHRFNIPPFFQFLILKTTAFLGVLNIQEFAGNKVSVADCFHSPNSSIL
jgi:hypothetical protein